MQEKLVLLNGLITMYLIKNIQRMEKMICPICNLFSRRDKYLGKAAARNDEYIRAECQIHLYRYRSNSTDSSIISATSFTFLLTLIPDLGVVCSSTYRILHLCLSHGTHHFLSYSLDLFLSIMTL